MKSPILLMSVLSLPITEIVQVGDIFLLRFVCPGYRCKQPLFEGYPLRKCECGADFSSAELILPTTKRKFRCLLGSRRQKRISKKVVHQLLDECGHACAYCSVDLSYVGYEVDHIKPLAFGGTNDPANLIISCGECNALAGSKVFACFEAKRFYLLERRLRRQKRHG